MSMDIHRPDEDMNARNINIRPNERSTMPGFGKSDVNNLKKTDFSK